MNRGDNAMSAASYDNESPRAQYAWAERSGFVANTGTIQDYVRRESQGATDLREVFTDDDGGLAWRDVSNIDAEVTRDLAWQYGPEETWS